MKTVDLLQGLLPGYEFLSQIGQGLGGETWLADSPQGLVAVKVLSQRKSRMGVAFGQMLNEATVLASVKHPHVVPYLAFAHDTAHGVAALVMKYIPGGDLASYVTAAGPFRSRDVATLGLTLVSALEALHEAGYLHRDLKPQNILVERGDNGQPFLYLADFGISQPLVDGMSQARSRALTPGYAAPEQWVTVHLGEGADTYALGAVLWFMFTGRHPGEDEEDTGPVAIVDGHAAVMPQDEADLALCRILVDMMAAETASRPGLGELRQRLEEVARLRGPPTTWETALFTEDVPAPGGRPPAVRVSDPTLSIELDNATAEVPVSETEELFSANTVMIHVPRASEARPSDEQIGLLRFVDTEIERPDGQHARSSGKPDPSRVTIGAILFIALASGLTGLLMVARAIEVGSAAAPAPSTHPAVVAEKPVAESGSEINFQPGPGFEYEDVPSTVNSSITKPIPLKSSPSGSMVRQRSSASDATPIQQQIATDDAQKMASDGSNPDPAASTPVTAPEAPKPGHLSVNVSRGWADVYIDGKKVDSTPIANREIAAGNHLIRVVNTFDGIDQTRTVEIEAGKDEKVFFPED